MRNRHRHHFEVNGTGAFPLDMLRYDSCWPASSEDAATIHLSISLQSERRTEALCRTISLTKYTFGDRPQITITRWQSFGWKVNQKTVKSMQA